MGEQKPGIIRRSYRWLMKFLSALRLLVVNLVFLVFVTVLVVVISTSELPTIPDKGALVLNIEGTLVDQKSYVEPLSQLLGESNPEQRETLLSDVIKAIDYARDDDRINTLVLSLDYFVHGGISKISELTGPLQSFRDTGKKIIAIGDNYSQDQYLLAAQADEIYINPMGLVWIEGYGVFRNYFKSALDKLEIQFHIFRVGEFKSAMEPFMRNDMSTEAKEANLLWLNTLWDEYLNTVAQRRRLKPMDINRYVNQADEILARYQGNAATMAVANGLIDGVKSREEMNRYLVDVVGAEDEDGYFQAIGFEQYLWLQELEKTHQEQKDKVGLIVASGNIVDGYHPPGTIGGDSTAQLIRQARLDPDIRALVVRVDSGGGSAFASEVIRRQLLLLQQAGKPLVVSMGSVAASGGYWISASADQIWATPTTITGSIGIFGAFPTLENTLENLGIATDGVGTTEMAGAMRIDRPLNPMAGRFIQSSIEYGYAQFLGVVAEGRDMKTDDVDSIAQGRVWSGSKARSLGLVDELGGLDQAIAAAAELAELEKYDTEIVELPLSPQEMLLRKLMGGEAMKTLRQSLVGHSVFAQWAKWLAPVQSQWQFIRQMNDPHGMYLHCTVCVAP